MTTEGSLDRTGQTNGDNLKQNPLERSPSIEAKTGPGCKSCRPKVGRWAPMDDFRQEALDVHNKYRTQHGVQKMVMSKECNDHAQQWAEHLAKTRLCRNSGLVLDSGAKVGLNLATKKHKHGAEYSGEDITDYWYSEMEYYQDYGKEPPQNKTNHYTQMIWKGSKEFGIGKAFDAFGGVVVVGCYNPPGNVSGKFTNNVMPPLRKA